MKEENKIDFKLLDSSIWLAYFFEGLHKELVENEEDIIVSTLSLYEIRKVLLKRKVDLERIDDIISFIKRRSISIPVDNKIAEKASEVSFKYSVPAIDSLIYITALMNEALTITLDNDFRKLERVKVL